MSQQVILKLVRSPEVFRTLVTGVEAPLVVSVLVPQQVKLSSETLVADVTHKHLLGFLDFRCVFTLQFYFLSSFCRNNE